MFTFRKVNDVHPEPLNVIPWNTKINDNKPEQGWVRKSTQQHTQQMLQLLHAPVHKVLCSLVGAVCTCSWIVNAGVYYSFHHTWNERY